MTAALHIAAAIIILACLIWAALWADRAWFKAYRKKRDQRANAAWWRALANERAKDEAGE